MTDVDVWADPPVSPTDPNIWTPGSLLQVNANYTLVHQTFTAAAAQTDFILTSFTYTVATNSLLIFKDGAVLDPPNPIPQDFTETSTSTFSLATPCVGGETILVFGFVGMTAALPSIPASDLIVNTHQEIRDYTDGSTILYARGTSASNDGGEGFFSLSAGQPPATYVDDGLYVLVPTGGDGSAAWLIADQLTKGIPFNNVVELAIDTILDASYRGVTILVDASAGAVLTTLPLLTSVQLPFLVTIKKVDSTSNAVTVQANAADDLDTVLAGTTVLTEESSAVIVVSDAVTGGTDWNTIKTGTAANNFIKDKFVEGVDYTSGTGSPVVLTLSSAPASINNIFLSLQGYYDADSDVTYTLSGSDITFASGIPAGVTKVIATHSAILPLGVTADESVTAVKIATSDSQAIIDKLITNGGLLPVRNYIINPQFDIWQRGTSLTAATASLHLADRWRTQSLGGSFSRDVDQITGLVHEYGHRLTANAAATFLSYQRIEFARSLLNKTVTVEAQVLVSVGASNCAVRVYDGSLGAGTLVSQPFTPTGSLQTVTLTGVCSTHIDAGDYWTLDIKADLGIGEVIELHEVRLVEGSAMPAMGTISRSIGEELVLCQRFFESSYNTGVPPGTIGTSGNVLYEATGLLSPAMYLPFKTGKRVTPATINIYSPATGAIGNLRDVNTATDLAAASFQPGEYGATFFANSVTPAAGDDLAFHFTVDAEL